MSSTPQQPRPTHASPHDVGGDHLLLIKIEGMHCHKCEQSIKKALALIHGKSAMQIRFVEVQVHLKDALTKLKEI